MKVYIVIKKDNYDYESRSYQISDIDSVYSTEDAARERFRELGSYYDYIEKVVR